MVADLIQAWDYPTKSSSYTPYNTPYHGQFRPLYTPGLPRPQSRLILFTFYWYFSRQILHRPVRYQTSSHIPRHSLSSKMDSHLTSASRSSSPSPPPSYPPPPPYPPPRWLLSRFSKEYGPIGQVGVDVPAAGDIFRLCDASEQCAHFTYQLGERLFHVKYGQSICWNEVVAQVSAESSLRSIGALALAPTVHHAFQAGHVIVIVMDHVEGDTILDLCKESDDERQRELAIEVGSALIELSRVPLPENLRPANVDGGAARPHLFWGPGREPPLS